MIERIIEGTPCEVYVERIGPAPAVPGDSVLVPIADRAHARVVLEVASPIGTAHDMRVHLVTVVSPGADAHEIEQTEQRLRASLTSEIEGTGEVSVIPSPSVVETLVELTGEHDVTVLGPQRIPPSHNSSRARSSWAGKTESEYAFVGHQSSLI